MCAFPRRGRTGGPLRRRPCRLEDLPGPVYDGVGQLVHGGLAPAQEGLNAERAKGGRRPRGAPVNGIPNNIFQNWIF